MNKNKTQLSLIPKENTLGNVFDKLTEKMWADFDIFASPLAQHTKGVWNDFFQQKNWEESENDFKTEIEIPRFSKEDIKLSIEENMLHISAEKDDKYRFYHSISLPPQVDKEKPSAKLEHGVLTISFPKKESAKPKMIEIK